MSAEPLPAGTPPPAPLVSAAARDDPVARVRRGAVWRAAGLLVAVIAGTAFARWVTLPGIPMCGFRILTGYPCPGCGMTRSLRHAARGEVLESVRMHPGGVAIAALVVAVLASALWALRTGDDPVWRWLARFGNPLALSAVALLVSVWLVRIFVFPEWSPDPIGSSVFGSR